MHLRCATWFEPGTNYWHATRTLHHQHMIVLHRKKNTQQQEELNFTEQIWFMIFWALKYHFPAANSESAQFSSEIDVLGRPLLLYKSNSEWIFNN